MMPFSPQNIQESLLPPAIMEAYLHAGNVETPSAPALKLSAPVESAPRNVRLGSFTTDAFSARAD
jgi:hypothetical protein